MNNGDSHRSVSFNILVLRVEVVSIDDKTEKKPTQEPVSAEDPEEYRKFIDTESFVIKSRGLVSEFLGNASFWDSQT